MSGPLQTEVALHRCRSLVTRVPFFSMEMRGVFPLKFYGEQAYGSGGPHADQWTELLDAQSDKFILVGGKVIPTRSRTAGFAISNRGLCTQS